MTYIVQVDVNRRLLVKVKGRGVTNVSVRVYLCMYRRIGTNFNKP